METFKLNAESGPTKDEMLSWSAELDALQTAAMEKRGRTEKIEYVNWIVQDLAAGRWDKARANYRNQSDKFGQWKEIDEFLTRIGVAEKIDWNKWRDADGA